MKKFLCVLLCVFCLGICFAGLTSVVGASPLDTIPPPITDAFIPVNQRSVVPVRNPGDFIGQVFAPKPEDWKTRPEAQPITGVTVTVASGPRAGESVATNPSGYYRFPNVIGNELHLRVEKEHFEPKEVRVRRFRPTILANGDAMNYTKDPQQHPGNILIGHRWPDEVRFIFKETLVVHDLLYVEGGRLPKGTDLGGFYSLGVVVLYSYQYADWKDEVGLLGTFAHEIAHAHQHATVAVDGSAWEIHGWGNTPEGRAYEAAQRKDWEQVGKSPLDNIYGDRRGKGGVALTETAAETCAHYWSVDRWGGRTAYGFLEVEVPNRYKWAEKWVPITIAVRPPSKVVSIPEQNLAAAIQVIPARLAIASGNNQNGTPTVKLTAPLVVRALDANSNGVADVRVTFRVTAGQGRLSSSGSGRPVTIATNSQGIAEVPFTPTSSGTHTIQASVAGLDPVIFTATAGEPPAKLLKVSGDTQSGTPGTRLANPFVVEVQDKDSTPMEGISVTFRVIAGGGKLSATTVTTGKNGRTQTFLTLGTTRAVNRVQASVSGINTPVTFSSSIEATVRVTAANRPPMYWVDTGTSTLHRLVGAKVENLIPSVQNPTGLAVDITNSKMYWTEKTGTRTGRIRRANLNSNPDPQLVKVLTSVPLYIAVDALGGKLYLINSWNKIQRMNLDGSGFQPNLVTGLEAPKGFAVDTAGDKIYWIEQTGKRAGKISRANLDGSAVEVVKDLISVPGGIALDTTGGKVYITNAYGKVQRMNLDGSNYQPNLITGLSSPMDLAVDSAGRKVYWTEGDSLRRSTLNGENVVDVVTGLGTSASLVLGTMPMDVGAPTAVEPISRENTLLANYPNPFNPETWIPYQLSKSAEVSIAIYAADGTLVRTLDLGHRSVGIYESRSRAAYWDGRNDFNEPVASGVYFYTLTAGEFTATRKMLIRK